MDTNKQNWLNKCSEWKTKWQYKKEILGDSGGIDLYYFVLTLSELLPKNSCIISTAGSSYYTCNQALRLKEGSRHICTTSAEMQSGLGLAVGCCFARNKENTILVDGDGSFTSCFDELQNLVVHKLPIKIFILSNNNFLSIRNTMKNMFDGRVFGTQNGNGLFVPSFAKIAETYDINYILCEYHSKLEQVIKYALDWPSPIIVELKCNPNQVIWPGAGFSKDENGKIIPMSLSRMSPQLSEDEIKNETIKD